MRDATLNGLDTTRGDIKLPYAGAWTSEIEMNADEAPTGSVVILLMGREFRGTVVADPNDSASVLSGESGGWYRCRTVGGAGGLDKTIQPVEWSGGATVAAILTQILGAGGEVQSGSIVPALLSKVLPQWSITRNSVGGALSALCETLGIIWRVLDDGTVWIGTPTPTPITPPEYILTEIHPETGVSELDLNSADFSPDHVFDGLTVRQVVYSWDGSEMRALVTHAPGPVNALFNLFGRWLSRVKLDNHKLVAGRISSQNSDNTVQFQPDQDTYSQLKRTAIRLGLPDTDVQINASSRAAVCWEGALPSNPVLVNFGDSTASKIKLAKSATPKAVARKGDAAGYLLCVIANVSGVPVVTSVNWSSVQPVPPFVTPIAGTPGSYYQKITITEGSSIVEAGG